MTERSIYQLWYGRDEPPVEGITLRAGPVTAQLLGRDLRNVRYGGLEIAQRIYIAIRDRNWDTVPGEISDLEVSAGADSFAVRFVVTHRGRDIGLTWRGEVLGAPDGTVSYAMDATVGADVTYKLIGLNVHHGMREYVGSPYAGTGPAGPVAGVFSEEIFPQLVIDETEVPVFPDVSSLSVRLIDDVWAKFAFEGDTFEFEDQRNWTDGSFKSQSYPPRRGGFFTARPGEHILQKVTLSVTGAPPAETARRDAVTITLGEPIGRGLPAIGFGMASHGEALSAREVKLLRALQPAHLRVDLHLGDPAYVAELARAAAACRALDCGLELALFVTANADVEFMQVGQRLHGLNAPVPRVLVFHETEQATSERWLRLAHERLGAQLPDTLFVGGANANFCELNRHRPGRPEGDGIAYAITPQIHAFDERSLAENLAPQAETVRTAKGYGDGAPVAVGPVTLKQRFNAVATSASPALVPGELPAPVDPRQMSLFAAGWTAGSVKYLAAGGAESVTYFETTGWRGVMETKAGSPEPEVFPSHPGEVFPLYHVFADLAEWATGELVAARSGDPLAVEALALRMDHDLHLLVANLTPRAQQAHVGSLPNGAAAVRRLTDRNAPEAMADPAEFRADREFVQVEDGMLRLSLAPFALVRVDLEL